MYLNKARIRNDYIQKSLFTSYEKKTSKINSDYKSLSARF